MTYLVHTAHAQLVGLWLGCVGWTLTAVALGLIQWRVWLVSDREVISSGVAWVGVWRVCFNSRTLVSPGFRSMHCRSIGLTEAFTPPDIAAAQVLMLLSVVVGLCGNAGGIYALRNIHFGMKTSQTRLAFLSTGALCLLAAVVSLIPLLWNLGSVVTNRSIQFPPEFNMPQTPDSQYVGSGIGVGLVGSVLMVISGVIFCMYRFPEKPEPRIQSCLRVEVRLEGTLAAQSVTQLGSDNPTFESNERL